MACSLERVVRPPAYRGPSGRPEEQTATPAGERWALSPGMDERSNRLARKKERADGTARAGTSVCWLVLKTGVPPATGTGTRSPSKHPGRIAGLTNSSSATEAGGVKAGTRKLTFPPGAVRCSVWLGGAQLVWRQRITLLNGATVGSRSDKAHAVQGRAVKVCCLDGGKLKRRSCEVGVPETRTFEVALTKARPT